MDVTVVVPYRGDEGGPRDAAWACVRNWWATLYPDWTVAVGAPPAGGPWCKACAVADALTQTDTGELLVVADADVICPDAGEAVAAVTGGVARWAVPHRRVHRLDEAVTAGVLAGGPLPDPAVTPRPAHHPRSHTVAWSHVGMLGGGVVVLPRALYTTVPLDPRFLGWGQEDASWGLALTVTAGKPWRGVAPLFHLRHPPAPRLSWTVGSRESLILFNRYRAARTPQAVAALIAELDPV